jgi:predicted  nucleic acid-binding Zn-ribbon protein
MVMSNTVEVHHEMNSYEKDIVEMKGDIKSLEKDVAELKRTAAVHNEQIKSINQSLGTIEENTTWIKRKITGAIITAIISGVIGGAIAVFYALLQK